MMGQCKRYMVYEAWTGADAGGRIAKHSPGGPEEDAAGAHDVCSLPELRNVVPDPWLIEPGREEQECGDVADVESDAVDQGFLSMISS